MPHIQQLDPHVADLIAAGEVVERPASVVKELMENAIDAGADTLTVEIQHGGMSLIRVTDNGCGIACDEAPTAFLRHATSKLRTEYDLEAIGTLGFRGEALAAISAVSRVELLTRTAEEELGAALSLEGGTVVSREEAGCPQGTTLVVRDLFYNTPARLKFMKKDAAEASSVAAVVQHLSLSNPHISFQFIKDGGEVLHTPGDNQLSSAIYSALGRDFALELVPIDGTGDGIRVHGYVTKPIASRGTRGMQTFFVNGRYIKSQLLTAALEEAYKNQMMKGKFPGCVLHLELPMTQVDVNVHPAKTVVKFANERQVFSAVYHVVQDTLDRRETPAPATAPQPEPRSAAAPRQDFYQKMDAKTFREEAERREKQQRRAPAQTSFVTRIPPVDSELGGRATLHDVVQPRQTPAAATAPRRQTPLESLTASPAPAAKAETPVERLSTVSTAAPAPVPSPPPAPATPAAPAAAAAREPDLPEQTALPAGEVENQTTLLEERSTPWRFVGEVLRTYIIAEDGENMWLIDKHAAHERMNFDRLKANTEPIMGQQLLSAEAVKFSPEDYAVLLEQLPLLEQFGFEAEDFGGESLMIRAIPSEIDASQIRETLEMLAEKLRLSGTADPSAARDAMLHTMACKAAIKGGWVSDSAELRVLMEKVQSGEVRYCPHGRPVAVKLTRYELEKMFKRA